jgi:hypothetical protein
MKRRMIFFSIGIIVILSTLTGWTASMAQSVKPAGQPQVAQPVPIWKQVNSDGFGDPYNQGIYGLEVFNSHLYATSGNW